MSKFRSHSHSQMTSRTIGPNTLSIALLAVATVACKTRNFSAPSSSTGVQGAYDSISDALLSKVRPGQVILFGEPLETPEVTTDLADFVDKIESEKPDLLGLVALEAFSDDQAKWDAYLSATNATEVANAQRALEATRDREALRGWNDKGPPFSARTSDALSAKTLNLLERLRVINAKRSAGNKIKVTAFDTRPNTKLDFRFFQLNLPKSFEWVFGRETALFNTIAPQIEATTKNKQVSVVLTGNAHVQQSGTSELKPSFPFSLLKFDRNPRWLGTRLKDQKMDVTSIEYGKKSKSCPDMIYQNLEGRSVSKKIAIDLSDSPLGNTPDFRCSTLLPGLKAVYSSYEAKDHFSYYVYLPESTNPTAATWDYGTNDWSERFQTLISSSTLSKEQKPPFILFVPGLYAYEIQAAVAATVWKIPGGRAKVGDYFEDQMSACKAQKVQCELFKMKTDVPIAENAKALAEKFKTLPKGSVVMAHSRGGIDSAAAMLGLSDDEIKNLGGFITINTPFHGIYPAELISKWSIEPVKKLFSKFYDVNDELGVTTRAQVLATNAAGLARLQSLVPMVTVGSWISAGNDEKSILKGLSSAVGSTLPNKQYSGLNDGIVAVEDTRLPGVPFVVLPQADHVSPVFQIEGGPALDGAALTWALPALLQEIELSQKAK
jgi:hypothetical protein